MLPPDKAFEQERQENIHSQELDTALQELSTQWLVRSVAHHYSYNFTWLGRPIIQYPQDVMAMQEIIWQVQPDLIIETGIAHGGSLIFYASMLELTGQGQVLGIDVDIRAHNRAEIEKHRMFKRIKLIQGSSIDESVVREVQNCAKGKSRVLVVLDSNHTHEHVLREMNLYSPLVTRGSYLVVFDTAIEELPQDSFTDRLWRKGNNPKTAVSEFLRNNGRFFADKDIDNKLLITTTRGGYLKCIKDQP